MMIYWKYTHTIHTDDYIITVRDTIKKKERCLYDSLRRGENSGIWMSYPRENISNAQKGYGYRKIEQISKAEAFLEMI